MVGAARPGGLRQRRVDPRFLRLLQGQQQLAQVALDEFLLQFRFLGRPLDEAAAFAVAGHVEAVQVEVLAVLEPDRHLQHVQAVVLVQAADAILALAQSQDVVFAHAFERNDPARRLGGPVRLRLLLFISG